MESRVIRSSPAASSVLMVEVVRLRFAWVLRLRFSAPIRRYGVTMAMTMGRKVERDVMLMGKGSSSLEVWTHE